MSHNANESRDFASRSECDVRVDTKIALLRIIWIAGTGPYNIPTRSMGLTLLVPNGVKAAAEAMMEAERASFMVLFASKETEI